MRDLVIEHNIRTEHGDLRGVPIILPASMWGEDWNMVMEEIPDEVPNTCEAIEGISPKDGVRVIYDQTFIRTAKDDYTLMREYI